MKLTRLENPGDSIWILVPGEPHGYVRLTRRGLGTPRAKAYHCWMREVQYEARAIGLKLPLEATYQSQVRITVAACFGRKNHPDIGNVQKGAEDALFYGSKTGDKHCLQGPSSYTELFRFISPTKPHTKILVERIPSSGIIPRE